MVYGIPIERLGINISTTSTLRAGAPCKMNKSNQLIGTVPQDRVFPPKEIVKKNAASLVIFKPKQIWSNMVKGDHGTHVHPRVPQRIGCSDSWFDTRSDNHLTYK